MSADSAKKRKTKVIRSDGGTVEKESRKARGDGEQESKVYSEEAEVETRDPAKDYDMYKKTCEDLQRLMAEIHELKSKGGKDASAEIDERRIQSCIHFMTLKKLNRLAHIRLKKGRDQTHEAKQKVDALHLQLQNLLYEVMHLQKEITKCLEFKSKHEEIDLVDVEEFYKEAPLDISKPNLTMSDPHQQTLSRLDWELEQRKSRLNLMQSHGDLQVSSSDITKQDKNLTVAIDGDVEEAKALARPPEDSQDDESDSDAEEEQTTTKRRRPTLGLQLDDKRREMLKRHPLSVTLDLKYKDGSILHLYFYYLMNLNIMTVKTKVTTATEMSIAISA
eukprot:g48447.t1